jgi:tetratricopeptide (TPR) repeat protein
LTSSASADIDLMRASMLLDANPAAAAASASAILGSYPQHEGARLLLAAARRRLGDSAAATTAMESLAAAHPNSAVMQLEVGRTYAAAGRGPESTAAFKRAVELDPNLADGWRELAAQHFLAGDTVSGDVAYARYDELAPDPPELIDTLVALKAHRLDAADALLRQQLQRTPGNPDALRLLATVAEDRGDFIEAERRFKECLELSPGDSAAREGLARLLRSQERISEALPLIERLLLLDSANARYVLLKSHSLRLIGRSAEAVGFMRQLVSERPDADVWLMFGNLHRELGDQASAIECFRKAIQLLPDSGEAYWALGDLKTYRFSDQDLEAMRAISARNGGGASIEFALGKALEDRGRYAESFDHYRRGNNQHRATIEYSAEDTSHFVQRSKAAFTREFFAQRAGWGSDRADPIFIVGLPRCGSTLLEQILASHPQIEGTRELPDVPLMVRELAAMTSAQDPVEYPERVGTLEKAQLQALAQRYLLRTQAHRPLNRPRFVDKMLGNFSHLALVRLMFPNARIIEARRHPMACAFSCFKQLFARGMNYSYEQSELGRYYRDYAELMAHMESVLPGGLYRVHYEQLIADPETEVRRLLEYCGLPWDEACLKFYDNPRVVQTISSEQVRRPLYSDAVDQWRHFEPWLGPLQSELAELIAAYPV